MIRAPKSTPAPLKDTLCGEPNALSVIVSDPVVVLYVPMLYGDASRKYNITTPIPRSFLNSSGTGYVNVSQRFWTSTGLGFS